MKFWKIIGFIFLACIALTFWPFAIGGGIIWYLWKKKKISNPKVRYGIIAICLLFSVFVGIGWVAALNSSSQQEQQKQSAQMAGAKPTEIPLSYKVLYTTTDKDSNGKVYDKQIYTLETPIFPYDETKIKDLLSKIHQKECDSNLDSCDIDLYDDQHFADESYAFDVADSTGQTALDTFDTKYPDFNTLNEHHLVADSWSGTVHFYPLLTVARQTITPSQTNSGSTTQSVTLTGSADLYPNHSLTPGEIFPNVTATQVCTSGYSSSVRNVSTSEKEEVFAEYGISYSTHASYEVDHFISLELGGDNSIKNLWPELGASPNQKDKVENYLHSEVCSGKITLAEAQREISTDWYKVYLSITSGTSTTSNIYTPPVVNTTTNTSGSTTTSTSDHPAGVTGKCNDGTYTTAVNHQGACSHHQGIAEWY